MPLLGLQRLFGLFGHQLRLGRGNDGQAGRDGWDGRRGRRALLLHDDHKLGVVIGAQAHRDVVLAQLAQRFATDLAAVNLRA